MFFRQIFFEVFFATILDAGAVGAMQFCIESFLPPRKKPLFAGVWGGLNFWHKICYIYFMRAFARISTDSKIMGTKNIALISLSFLTAASAFCADCAEAPSALLDEEIFAPLKEGFSAEIGVGFESAYIFRGAKLASASIVPTLDLACGLGGGFGLRGGFFNDTSLENSSYVETDITCGITYAAGAFAFDAGYCAYLYPHDKDTHEFSFCVSCDTSEFLGDFAVSPFAAYYYDVVLYANTVEAGLSYSAPLTKWLIGSEWGGIDLAATYGHVFARRSANDYNYVMFSADFKIALTSFASLSAGVRFSNKSAGGANSEDNCWFGTGMKLAF